MSNIDMKDPMRDPEPDQVVLQHGDIVTPINVSKNPLRLRITKSAIAQRYDPATETEEYVDLILEKRK